MRYFGFAKTIYEVKGSDVLEDALQTSGLYEFEITEGIPCLGIPTLTYGERKSLEMHLGMSQHHSDSVGHRGTY